MSKVAVLVVLVLASCTKINPDLCCVTEQQCAAVGVGEHRPCAVGQACSPATATCVASECDTSPDCTSPNAPVCINHLCVGACQVDDDCLGIPDKPRCLAASGRCVGCLDAATCPGDKPFCDADAHSCRGCQADDQCASGVCVEADGVCATSDQILRVSSIGADAGDCVDAPCASLGYALQKVTPERSIIHVSGGALPAQQSTISLDRPVVIDGDGTTLFPTPAAGPSFAFVPATSGVVTIENLMLTTAGTPRQAITIGQGDAMRLYNVAIDGSDVHVDGSLDARKLRLRNGSQLSCSGGTLTVRDSVFDMSDVIASNCATTVAQNRFDPVDLGVQGLGGLVTVENNIFVVPSEFSDVMHVGSNVPGSVVAFNTIVNTSSVVQSPVAINCDATDNVTSNIIAYHSTDPITGNGCVVHASLFDLTAGADAAGNVSADVATFFTDRTVGDFHLAGGSPALGLGEPGIVTTDFTGGPRPARSGSLPAAGAYEAR